MTASSEMGLNFSARLAKKARIWSKAFANLGENYTLTIRRLRLAAGHIPAF